MGAVRYPRLHISLPVRHGTDAATLEKSAGHLYGTSLPVGDESTHAVVAAHRGLACISSSRCFVFSHVFFSGWGWCRFVGLVVDSITTNHATRPSSRRRSMMLMPNSVLIRLSRYQTM